MKIALKFHRTYGSWLGEEGLGMTDTLTRINGWKSIAAHFGRDRTTVMRWARSPDFPVRRMPGNGSSSVYAFTYELDAWLTRGVPRVAPADLAAADAAIKADGGSKLPVRRRHPFVIAFGVLAVAAAAAPFAIRLSPVVARGVTSRPLPADPELAAIYLQARDDWASRTADGLHRAVNEFGTVTSRDPKFAPAYAGLADAYLLIREFDALPEAKAYPQAEAAAKAALAIDPNCGDAHRALAFVDYYWRHDNVGAREHFSRALMLDPQNSQTHFWYGNALVNNGEMAAGLNELNMARLREPGSVAIRADYGWALWQSGRREAGRAALDAIEREAPSSVSSHSYLATINLMTRNYAKYLDESSLRARLRGDMVMARRTDDERATFAKGGSAALLELMRREADAAHQLGAVTNFEWQATLAALAGDRARLLSLLEQADLKNERWGRGGVTSAAFISWASDREVAQLIGRRRGESLVAS